MGKLVDYKNDAGKRVAPGVTATSITGSEGRHMQAEFVKVAGKSKLTGTVPAGSDQYLFVLSGKGKLSDDKSASHDVAPGSFALIEEGRPFALTAEGESCEVVSVVAPPPGSRSEGAGFCGGIKILSMHEEPVHDFADKKKQRVFLVTKENAGSERAHGMIVKYVQDTETTTHAHPDAESLFVFLEGETRLTINGSERSGKRGNAAFFPAGDKHSLHGTPGGSNFLEFHIPGGYTTVR